MLRDFAQGRVALKVVSTPVALSLYAVGEEEEEDSGVVDGRAADSEPVHPQARRSSTLGVSSPTFRTLALVSFFGQRDDVPAVDGASSSRRHKSIAVSALRQPAPGASASEPSFAALDIHGFLALFYCRLAAQPISIENDLQPLFQRLVVRTYVRYNAS